MAKKKSKASTARSSTIQDTVVSARNKSGETLHKGEVVLIRGFGKSEDGGWELEVVKAGSGVLWPAFYLSPMRPIVAPGSVSTTLSRPSKTI